MFGTRSYKPVMLENSNGMVGDGVRMLLMVLALAFGGFPPRVPDPQFGGLRLHMRIQHHPYIARV